LNELPGQPYGHIPGVHLPGTLIPIGAVVEQQQERERAEQAAREKREWERRRANLLLTLD
jgi:hypothetical protein